MTLTLPTLTRQRYRMCSLVIESDLPLVELDAAGDDAADVQLSRVPSLDAAASAWLDSHRDDFADGFYVGVDEQDRLVVHLDRAATFVTSADGSTIDLWVDRSPDEYTSHLLVDHVVPRMLARRGFTVLHATAVDLGGAAVAFVGRSGAGKSTMAMSFVAAGARLMADDCLVLDTRDGAAMVTASYAGGRLLPDSAGALGMRHGAIMPGTGKHRIRLDQALESGVRRPLAALFVLERSTERDATVELEALAASRAFWDLADQTYLFSVDDDLGGLADVVDVTPVYRLRYPTSFDSLVDVHRAVRAVSVDPTCGGGR
jgi:hypothetical protein